MPVKYAKSEVPLIGNKEFADFLVKEFRMPEGMARETAFRYPQEKKEMMLLLKEWIAKADFESIEGLLGNKSYGTISENLQILEKHRTEPSVWLLGLISNNLEENIKILEENKIQSRMLLGANPAYLKANIQALKDRGRNPAEYARAGRLGEEPEYFKEFLDKFEGDIIRKLKEKMPKVPIEDIEALVNKTPSQILPIKIEALEKRRIDISGFTNIKEFVDIIRPPVAELGRFSGTPKNEKVAGYSATEWKEVITFYTIPDKRQFKYIMAGLYPNEQEAFKKIEQRIRDDGKMSKKEIREIFKEHAPNYIVRDFSEALDSRLSKILKNFEKDGALKKSEEIVEKQE